MAISRLLRGADVVLVVVVVVAAVQVLTVGSLSVEAEDLTQSEVLVHSELERDYDLLFQPSVDTGFNLFFQSNREEWSNHPIHFQPPLPYWVTGTLGIWSHVVMYNTKLLRRHILILSVAYQRQNALRAN
nr:hypothetical protein BaRGS_034378 [Batillaria attramentaria]